MNRTVHVVAVAARTPVGLTAEASAAAVRAGISRVQGHPFMIDAAGERMRCGLDAGINFRLIGVARHQALVTHALSELVGKVAGAVALVKSVTLYLALPEHRPGFAAPEELLIKEALLAVGLSTRISLRVELLAQGHAGALQGFERACLLIAQGGADLCFAGGVDSYFAASTLDWLEAALRVSREGVRSGFHPGEGAAILALASESARRRFGLRSLAKIAGVACGVEKRDPRVGAGLLGEAMTEVLQRVRASAGAGSPIDDVYCDINGERPRTTDWGFVLLREGAWFRDGCQYVTPVDACGDLGAASGAFNAVLATRAWTRNYAEGTRALVWGASWNGLRSALVLERTEG